MKKQEKPEQPKPTKEQIKIALTKILMYQREQKANAKK